MNGKQIKGKCFRRTWVLKNTEIDKGKTKKVNLIFKNNIHTLKKVKYLNTI